MFFLLCICIQRKLIQTVCYSTITRLSQTDSSYMFSAREDGGISYQISHSPGCLSLFNHLRCLQALVSVMVNVVFDTRMAQMSVGRQTLICTCIREQ